MKTSLEEMYPGITEDEVNQFNELLNQQDAGGRAIWFDAEQKLDKLRSVFSKKYPNMTIKSCTKKG